MNILFRTPGKVENNCINMKEEDHEMSKSVFSDRSGIPLSVRIEITTVFEILDTILPEDRCETAYTCVNRCSFSSYLPVQVGLVLS